VTYSLTLAKHKITLQVWRPWVSFKYCSSSSSTDYWSSSTNV